MIVSGAAAVTAAVALATLVHILERRRGSRRWRWRVGAALLPFAAVAYTWAAFGAYAIWCETVRGVDMGIGDSWRVPLADGYAFTMIDTEEQAFIRDAAGRQSHFGLARIGAEADVLAGEDAGGFFLIDTRHGEEAGRGSRTSTSRARRCGCGSRPTPIPAAACSS